MKARLWLLAALCAVVALGTAPAAEKQKGLKVDGALQIAVRDSADKRQAKPSEPSSKTVGGFQVGSCTSTAPTAPNTSWPARGQAAITFCKP